MQVTNDRRGKKTKDKKPLYILLAFLIFFCFFIFLITRPSAQSKALKELETSFNKKDVEMVWYKYKSELYQDEEFLLETRKKLSKLNLSEDDLKECKEWLPPAPSSVNLIVVPDLSRRVKDPVSNPNQIANDIFVLKSIWTSFVERTKLKQNSHDRLIIDVTDIDQARGQFALVADRLQFDLSDHKGKSNRLFFTKDKDVQFERNIKEMYALAEVNPLGADYRLYVRRYLANHLKKSTLFENYINKVIFITDGYLEAENKPHDTKIYGYEPELFRAVNMGNILQVITGKGLNIPKENIDLADTEVLICEVNERKSGKGYHFEILRTYWQDWMERMNIKKFEFIAREQANELTGKRIKEFILK
ncbi:hypothetical protein [Desertivirga arenae]|uniref:hypothetical protein n=1 Tax=Desertivirga arenae TaxID=2810309 RepID=UPI001A96F303|nr:hypothetical protein [Pedobacter sp. SYSU D00823]